MKQTRWRTFSGVVQLACRGRVEKTREARLREEGVWFEDDDDDDQDETQQVHDPEEEEDDPLLAEFDEPDDTPEDDKK